MKIIFSFLILLCSLSAFTQDTLYVIFDEDSLIVPLDSTRAKVLATAKEYLGVSYHYGQSNPDGFDCSGYVKYVFGCLGYELPRSSYEQYKKSRRIKTKYAQPGDLVFFTTRKRTVGHVGIYLGNNQFIHAPGKGKTVSIANLDGPYYKKRLVGFGGYL